MKQKDSCSKTQGNQRKHGKSNPKRGGAVSPNTLGIYIIKMKRRLKNESDVSGYFYRSRYQYFG